MLNLPSRARVAKRTISASISLKPIVSALRITGTTKPFGVDTATDTSQKLWYTISSPSMYAFTEGKS